MLVGAGGNAGVPRRPCPDPRGSIPLRFAAPPRARSVRAVGSTRARVRRHNRRWGRSRTCSGAGTRCVAPPRCAAPQARILIGGAAPSGAAGLAAGAAAAGARGARPRHAPGVRRVGARLPLLRRHAQRHRHLALLLRHCRLQRRPRRRPPLHHGSTPAPPPPAPAGSVQSFKSLSSLRSGSLREDHQLCGVSD